MLQPERLRGPKWSLLVVVTGVFLLPIAGWPATPVARSAKGSKDPCAGSADEKALLSCRQSQNTKSEQALRQLVDKLARSYEQDEPPLAKVFATAQAKWAEYRDAECKVRTYESASGPAYEVYRLDCVTSLNGERIEVLRKQASNP